MLLNKTIVVQKYNDISKNDLIVIMHPCYLLYLEIRTIFEENIFEMNSTETIEILAYELKEI